MEGINWSDLFNAMDKFLLAIVHKNVLLVYVVLFAIYFAETGLVFMAFLPGDSLLFIAGAVAAQEAGLNVWVLAITVSAGAIAGNTMNYYIGAWLGHKIYDGSIAWIHKTALDRTHEFYERWGGITLVLARFTPLVRSVAPLVAGAGAMQTHKFHFYSVTGAVLWVGSLVGSGYLFGNVRFVRENLGLILIAGLAAATVPVVLGAAWRVSRNWSAPAKTGTVATGEGDDAQR